MITNPINYLKEFYADTKNDFLTSLQGPKHKLVCLTSDIRLQQLARYKIASLTGMIVGGSCLLFTTRLFLAGALLVTSIKIALLVSLVIVSHDVYVMAKKQQAFFSGNHLDTTLLYDATTEEMVRETLKDVWFKPLWGRLLPSLIN